MTTKLEQSKLDLNRLNSKIACKNTVTSVFTFFVIFLTLSGSGFAKADVDVASASEKENTNQAESYAVEESVESRTYVTQFGDTLGGVAKKLFNRPDYWKVLLYYNQEAPSLT